MVWIFVPTNESSLYVHALEYIHPKHTHFHILNACCNVVISNVTHISWLCSVFQPQQESSEKNLVSEKRIGFYNSQQYIYCKKMFSLILQLRQYSQTSTKEQSPVHFSVPVYSPPSLFLLVSHKIFFFYFFELFVLSALFNIRHECTPTLCSQLPNKIVQCSLQCFSSP